MNIKKLHWHLNLLIIRRPDGIVEEEKEKLTDLG